MVECGSVVVFGGSLVCVCVCDCVPALGRKGWKVECHGICCLTSLMSAGPRRSHRQIRALVVCQIVARAVMHSANGHSYDCKGDEPGADVAVKPAQKIADSIHFVARLPQLLHVTYANKERHGGPQQDGKGIRMMQAQHTMVRGDSVAALCRRAHTGTLKRAHLLQPISPTC